MNGQLIREWVRISYHCPLSLHEYLSLTRWERFEMNHRLDQMLDQMDGTSDPPRAPRRGGFSG